MKKEINKRKEVTKDKRIFIRVTEVQLAEVRALAKKHNTTVSKLILQRLLS